MAGIISAVIISIGLPVTVFFYASYRKLLIPFSLGVLAFVLSQIVLRIRLLTFLGEHNTDFLLFSSTQPILYAVLLGLSADIFEELARFAAMHFFSKETKSSIERWHFVVILVTNYCDANRVFTNSFNEQEEVAGLYVKYVHSIPNPRTLPIEIA